MAQFFCYDGESMQFFDNAKEAKELAESALEYETDVAGNDGWQDSSLDICWGRIMECVEVVSERKLEPHESEDFDLIQERSLVTKEIISLNVDVATTPPQTEADKARALHRVVRAMHDGNCPSCGHLGTAESFYHIKINGFPSYHSCPRCKFYITEKESEDAIQSFLAFHQQSREVFLEWRSKRSIKP